MTQPTLIVLEGLDGAGKSTQLDLLGARLAAERSIRTIAFPDYDDPSSALVRMYLGGEFGASPYDTSAYAASILYAADRFASYRRHWQTDYHEGKIILSDRYTQANIVYQMPKLPRSEWHGFIDWLYDLEYGKMGIPKPDLVVLLDLDPALGQKQVLHRNHGDPSRSDIHERDRDYLDACREAALVAASYLGWTLVSCGDGSRIRSREEISDELYEVVEKAFPISL